VQLVRSRTSVLNVGAYKDLRKGFNIMSGLDLGICGFSHVGFAVPSVEQFAETWGSVLGIDNWSTHEESASGGVFVDGAPPAPLRVKVAFARAGGLAIELIETMEGQTCHSRASEHFAPGLHHLAFWVRDLVGAVKTAIDGGLTVSMAPSSLIAKIGGPEAASQVLRSSAASDAHGSTGVPDFFTFLEGFGKSMNFTLELLDQEFANDYLQLNGHQPHAPNALT
jgi:catechol 2,3-dioxygenase-like lactoylglutathione lyase family enzyme